jgi:glycosyltransferase involved in cell wall biosynthesis
MRLAVVSHKVCWRSTESASGFVTDGGFPVQMAAISELFSETRLVVPCDAATRGNGVAQLEGHNLSVVPLSMPSGTGLRRKIGLAGWVLVNARRLWKEIKDADAVHAPIPGDVGTIGIAFAMIQRKPLLVRHCGNWFVQRSSAERFWKWGMERVGGGRNVMLATGGSDHPPSAINPNIKWIFSTSLRADQIGENRPRRLSADGKLRLIIVCRQEERKGTDIAIASMPLLPDATLDVVGGGSLLPALKEQAKKLGVSDRVSFHGKVPQSRVLGFLKRADLFCYPTSASEGFPKVVVEALAVGLPVITTRVSVLPQLLKNGCGLILDNTTPESLAAAVTEIANDPDLYSSMSRNAIETALTYSLENWRDSIAQTLREAWAVDSLS